MGCGVRQRTNGSVRGETKQDQEKEEEREKEKQTGKVRKSERFEVLAATKGRSRSSKNEEEKVKKRTKKCEG